MDFNTMIQHTTHLEEYAVPVSVLLVFLLLIHQRHRFAPINATHFEHERPRKSVRPPSRIQRAASAAAAAVAAEMDEFDADDTAGSVEESDGVIEDLPSLSDSLSSSAEDAVVAYSNSAATRAGSLYSIPEHHSPDGRARGSYRYSPQEDDARTVPEFRRNLSAEGRRSSRPGSRSTTISSMALQPDTTPVRRVGGLGSSTSRIVRAPPATTDSRASSLSVELLLPKVESDDEVPLKVESDNEVPISTPLPPKRALTPRTPSKVRGGRTFSQGLDNPPSDDVAPLSSPLPPKQSSSARRSSGSTSRNNSILSSSSLSRGPSSAASSTASTRSRTTTPSSAAPRAFSHTSRDATSPPSSVASSASATISRTQSPDIWGSVSRMSSLSPTPTEVTERWIRKVSSRTLPSADGHGVGRVVTAWFESTSEVLIDSPPDLRDHRDLQPGDLFYHFTSNDYQLWIWEVNDDGMLGWVPVKFFSVRNGLYLTLTPEEQRPSWVSEKYAHDRKRKLRLQGYNV